MSYYDSLSPKRFAVAAGVDAVILYLWVPNIRVGFSQKLMRVAVVLPRKRILSAFLARLQYAVTHADGNAMGQEPEFVTRRQRLPLDVLPVRHVEPGLAECCDYWSISLLLDFGCIDGQIYLDIPTSVASALLQRLEPFRYRPDRRGGKLAQRAS